MDVYRNGLCRRSHVRYKRHKPPVKGQQCLSNSLVLEQASSRVLIGNCKADEHTSSFTSRMVAVTKGANNWVMSVG